MSYSERQKRHFPVFRVLSNSEFSVLEMLASFFPYLL